MDDAVAAAGEIQVHAADDVRAAIAFDTDVGGPRIVNGVTTAGFPSVVALIDATTRRTFCTGTLIGCSTVLTAAHCVCDPSLYTGAHCQASPPRRAASTIKVFLQHAAVANVASVSVHPGFVFGVASDVAVMKLTSPVTGIAPSSINLAQRPPIGLPGTIVGFGLTTNPGTRIGLKRYGDVTTASCVPSGGLPIPSSQHVCWDYASPVGPPGDDSNTCKGDSGGPLFMSLGGSTVVAGVTSGGSSASCQPTDHSYDADVFANAGWIVERAGFDLGSTECGGLAIEHILYGDITMLPTTTFANGSFQMPSGMSRVRFTLSGEDRDAVLSGVYNDFDLLARYGTLPTLSTYDCASALAGTKESCEVANPASGEWWMRAHNFSGTWGDGQIIATLLRSSPSPSESGDDVAFRYGSGVGIWARMNDSVWQQIHSSTAQQLAIGDVDGSGKDDIAIDFGSGAGIWVFKNNATWMHLHPLSPEWLATGDMDGGGKDELIVDFGSGYGTWIFRNGASWAPLHPASPDFIVSGDMDGNGKDEVIIDFGAGYGIWILRNDASWTHFHPLSPEAIVTGDMDGNGRDEVIIDFGPGVGTWVVRNDAAWIRLHGASPELMATGDMDGGGKEEVFLDFGPGIGIWVVRNDAVWFHLHGASPIAMATADMDGTGKDEVIVDLGAPYGIWTVKNDAYWFPLSPGVSSLEIQAGDMDG